MASQVAGYIGKLNPGNGTEYSLGSTAYGVCDTAAATAAKVVDMTGFTLITGATVFIKFKNANSVANPTLNVNNTGAKPMYLYGTTAMSSNTMVNGWRAGAILSLTYDGTGWIRTQWDNSTYYYESVYTSTAADTAAKVGSSTNYTLEAGKYFQVLIVNSNTSQSALTLNINNKGAKPIYINGTVSSSSNYTLPSGYYLVYYDGTNYYFRTDDKITGNITGNASTADKVNKNLVLKIKSGSTEGTDLYTFNGSAAKILNIKAGNNVTLTAAAGELTIAATDTTYSAMSVAEMKTGTATTGRVMRADYLKSFLSTLGGTYLTLTHDATNGLILNHDASGVTAGTYGSATQVPKITVDAQGHITGVTATTITNSRDPGYGKIKAGTASTATTAITANTSTAEASTYNETLTINPGNKWIAVAANNSSTAGSDTFTIAHSTSGATAGNYGDSSNQTPAYGGTFNVPYISIDAGGHVTGISTHTVKIPASDNFKVVQTAVNTGSATTNKWVSSIQQNTNGDITATMSTLDTSGTWSGNAATATSASKLQNTSKIGDTNKPVYFTANGVPAAISYTINKSVPSDAVFTDTWTALSTSAAGYVAKAPNDTHKFLRGDATWAEIAAAKSTTLAWNTESTIATIGGYDIKVKLPANPNTNTDTLVTQTSTTTNANYELLFSATADNTTRTETARKNSNLIFNPSTGRMTVTGSSGASGEYVAQRGDTASMFMGFGAGDSNHGLYSWVKDGWMIYADSSGNVTVNGNAATATKLATARTINGTSFDGSSDITTNIWGTARTITIGATGKSVNGSANVSWSLAEINGSTAVGGTTQPIYWTGSAFSATTYSLSATVNAAGAANQVAYYSGTNTISAKAPAWSAWTAGTTAGPKANIQIGNATYTSAAIPSATATASGIVTTGDQTFKGIKTFYNEGTTANNVAAGIQFSNKDTTTGQTYSTAYIYAYQDHATTTYGTNMVIRSGGNLFLGSGESPSNLYSAIINNFQTSENLYMTADGTAYLYANANTIADRVGLAITTDGNLIPQKAESINNNVQSLGASNNRWSKVYIGTADSYGSTTQPIYWNAGVPTAITGAIANNTTGNAATATKLAASKTINGTSFDGSANITTANWGTTRTLTIGNESVSVNGSTSYSWPHPLKIYYYGSNNANSAGWYKMCTVSLSGNNDCNLNLLITSGHNRQATGLLHVHVRCDNGTANNIKTLKWMYRYGWSAEDVYYVDNGDNTWSLYVNQTNPRYGRIQVQILTETGTSTSQQNMLWSNNTTKESEAPTGGTAATDGGIVNISNQLGTSTVGSATQPIYLNNGIATATTYSLNATVSSSANANRIAYYSGANTISAATNHVYGSSTYKIENTAGGTTIGFQVKGKTYQLQFIIGSGDTNRGIYDQNDWWFYRDSAHTYIKDATQVSTRLGVNGYNSDYTFYVNGTSYSTGYFLTGTHLYFGYAQASQASYNISTYYNSTRYAILQNSQDGNIKLNACTGYLSLGSSTTNTKGIVLTSNSYGSTLPPITTNLPTGRIFFKI